MAVEVLKLEEYKPGEHIHKACSAIAKGEAVGILADIVVAGIADTVATKDSDLIISTARVFYMRSPSGGLLFPQQWVDSAEIVTIAQKLHNEPTDVDADQLDRDVDIEELLDVDDDELDGVSDDDNQFKPLPKSKSKSTANADADHVVEVDAEQPGDGGATSRTSKRSSNSKYKSGPKFKPSSSSPPPAPPPPPPRPPARIPALHRLLDCVDGPQCLAQAAANRD